MKISRRQLRRLIREVMAINERPFSAGPDRYITPEEGSDEFSRTTNWQRKDKRPRAKLPGWFVETLKIFDPTGISSWKDLRDSIKNWDSSDPASSVMVGLNLLGCVPLIGKGGSVTAKSINYAAKTKKRTQSYRQGPKGVIQITKDYKKTSSSLTKALENMKQAGMLKKLNLKDVDYEELKRIAKYIDDNKILYKAHLAGHVGGGAVNTGLTSYIEKNNLKKKDLDDPETIKALSKIAAAGAGGSLAGMKGLKT